LRSRTIHPKVADGKNNGYADEDFIAGAMQQQATQRKKK
jgi:hypothetical protein